jgi:phosphatidate phosphatase APP1
MPPGDGAPERDGYRYPLYRRNDRALPGDWDGPIYIWDIDNTYLVTEWSGLRDLIRIRFEAAEDKRPVPGAVELLGGLRRGSDPDARPPVFFVSASPETMREVLERRMLLDGVMQDGITFRDLRRLRYLRDIFGYKTAALLLYRLENPGRACETLFGDDREHDPEV